MTTPTQAQIEAAASLLKEALPDSINFYGSIRLAERILVAAAQVGEPNPVLFLTKKLAEKQRELNATIERCAKVADKYSVSAGYWVAIEIRKLKDEP